MPEIVFRSNERGLHQIRPDLKGSVIEGANITLVRWVIESGKVGTPVHFHEKHEQFTIVLEGSVETMIGDTAFVLNSGDVCRIQPKVPHGNTRALGGVNAVLIDVFEPCRTEYVEAAKREADGEA